MWSKISNALKPTKDIDQDQTTDVLSRVYEQHPNLSVFHETTKKLGLPKKVRSHLHLRSNSSQVSLARGSSSDTVRDSSRPSLEGSVRSILRDPKTPGTGQNVRFFSRDAYKVISPDASASSSEPSPISFVDRLARVARPSAMDVFAEADTSNLFNLSPGNEMPQGLKTPMLDTAIEIPVGSPQETSTPFRGLLEVPVDPSFALSPTSSTFSAEISIPPTSPPPRTRRSRALSDTVFQTMLRKHAPEADINDTSNASLVLVAEPPDPFRANATTYYTPGTMIPPTPPQPTHSRAASKEEDIIWNLRTQLALSQELCAQYEIDLGARDELVQALTHRADVAEKEKEKSRNVLRSWKKKAGELERMCRTLEEEVDTSRQESLERSVMDEASGEALRMLHRQISQLEREKEALQDHADTAHLRDQLREKDAELDKLREEIKSRDDAERVLRDGIQEAREQMDYLTTNSVRSSMAEEALILSNEEERERHSTIEHAWAEERMRMVDAHDALQTDKNALADAVQRISSELERINSEHTTAIETVHKDLDAAHQESAELHNTIEDLQNDNEALKSELEALETKLLNMEEEWSEGENQRVELESELQRATEEHETRITCLTAELTFANENVFRLESNIKERDAAISTLTTTLLTRTDEAESLREELTTIKVEHSRAFSSQTRALQDLQTQEKDLRTQLEVAVREKAESDIMLGMSKERVGSLMDEVAKLRRTVHEMQQTSAARDVTILQLRKERERDREDVNGLNIALDSKQQELELIKRKISLKSVAVSSTPVPSRVIRRESMIGTPSSSRPPSSMSDASKDGKSDTPSTSLAPRASFSALTRSVRINATTNPPGKMGPPAPKSRSSLATTTPPTRTSLASSTTSRAPSSLGKSNTTPRPSGLGTGAPRRVSTSSVESNLKTPVASGARRVSASSSVPSEIDEKEKENVTVTVSARGVKTPRRVVPA
ncbi:uncharacterized protein BJ212DRAFT_1485365 [Suillus subaureus]|uniref:Uncharacterized protein n=1 Tax=Suillus subaureus TaxID=48587 RepID=A0A9P7J874_9AGAM|nr:uncharacterized protein BJ212DRAFT_1485365 [Suillus subaureus]KAG1807788.1 hypothetical protein BJ212DRAFT_1485365 [Suillus subaureus]